MGALTARLLPFARELQRAVTFEDLLAIARAEVLAVVGYRHTWMFVAETEAFTEVRLINVSGDSAASIWEHAPVLSIAGDAMLEEIVRGDAPVVVADARTDPRTDKNMVAKMHNRTIVNIPLRLLDRPFGVWGLGTFGDEGCRTPTEEELDYLVAMSAQIAVASGRIRMHEERRLAEARQRTLERQLFHAQRLESVAVLAGGLAHDFNNLLTIIIAGVGLARLRDGADCEELQQVEEAARRGSDLTRQLLAVSRAQPLSAREVDLNELLRKLLVLIQRIVPESVHVELVANAVAPTVCADPSMLEQVFLNLCVNARDAMPAGGRLTITTAGGAARAKGSEESLAPEHRVVVTVADTGTGMPAEVLDRIFEPFFTTKPTGVGTGLGLAVVYGIVRQHGGLVTCTSQVGAGTTFTIDLPLHAGGAVEPAPNVEPSSVALAHGSARILVAEDDPGVRAVTTRLLEHAGHTVRATADGESAVRCAAEEPFDLAVLDVVMPGISGFETLERIRALRPETRFILVSGYAPPELALRRIGSEGIEFCGKPYNPCELLGKIQRALAPRARVS